MAFGASSKKQAIVHVPLSERERVAGGLNARLSVADISYNLLCFGSVITLVPERLGRNRALDTATDLFTTLYSTRLRSKNSWTPAVLNKYGDSLRALQVAVQKPGTHNAAETMCAVYMIMVCQVRRKGLEATIVTIID